MKKHERIEINPDIMFGKPVIRGTRITVELILRKLAGGMTPEEIIKDHPHLKIEDILALGNLRRTIWSRKKSSLLQEANCEIPC